MKAYFLFKINSINVFVFECRVASLVSFSISETFNLSCSFLMRGISTFSFFNIHMICVSSHDASHLIVYLCLISSILHRATSQSKDCDNSVSLEESLIIYRIVSLLEEVILIGVIVLDTDFPVCIVLTQKGASMRENFSIDETGARDNDLSVFHILN